MHKHAREGGESVAMWKYKPLALGSRLMLFLKSLSTSSSGFGQTDAASCRGREEKVSKWGSEIWT